MGLWMQCPAGTSPQQRQHGPRRLLCCLDDVLEGLGSEAVDVLCEETLSGAAGDDGSDGRWQTCPSHAPQEASLLLGQDTCWSQEKSSVMCTTRYVLFLALLTAEPLLYMG